MCCISSITRCIRIVGILTSGAPVSRRRQMKNEENGNKKEEPSTGTSEKSQVDTIVHHH